MRESILRNTERFLKRCLKGRLSITVATIVGFIITGGVVFGEQLTETQYYHDGGKHDNSNDIVTLGNRIHGIDISNQTFLINSGNISTNGEGSIGLLVNDSTVINTGTIETNGGDGEGSGDAWAVMAGNSAIVENNGIIRTNGTMDRSETVLIHSDSKLTNNKGGVIEANGYQIKAVSIQGNSSMKNTGTIITIGDESSGIRLSEGATFINNKEGTVKTDGNNSAGIEVWEGESANIIINDGSIETGGDNSKGIIGTSVNIENNGKILTSGNDSTGIEIWVNGNKNINIITNNSSIKTEGDNSRGIVGGYIDVRNNGIVTTSGSDGTGIAVWKEGNVINDGSIQTTGDYSRGINGFNNSYVENNGTIETKGKRSYGAKVKGNSKMINSGNITTDGYRANGIRSEYYTDATNKGSIKTNGDNAYGLESYYEGYLENNGEVITTGNSTQGRTAAGMIMSMGSDGKNTNKVATTGIGSVGIKVLTSLYDWDEYDPETLEGTDYKVMHKALTESNFVNTGLVKTSGNAATGIAVVTDEAEGEFYTTAKEEGWELDHPGLENGSKLENTGTIETEGNASYGIYAYTEEGLAKSEVYNYKSGIVKTTGDGSTGAYIENSIFNNEGIIETFGDKAYGIYSDNSSVDNSGTIRTHGEGSYGIYAVNKSTVNHTGKIYVDDPNAYGIVYDQTSKVTVSEDAVIEVGGNGSNGIQIISSAKPVVAYSEPVVFRAAAPMSSARRSSGIAEPFSLRSEVTTYAAAVPVQERAQLSNLGSISATGAGANAIVLKDADLINTGSISSERGYAIVSTGGNNTVTLGEGSNVDGIIKGGSGSDVLFLDGNNTDDLKIEGYNRMVKTGGGTWNLENSSIELIASNELPNISSYSEAAAIYKNIGGEIVIGDNSTVTIKVDQKGESGQLIAEGVTVEGNVNLDIDSSKNNGARDLKFEDMVVTKNGVILEDSGNIAVVSGGWKVDYQVESDGTVDVELKKIRYEDRANSAMSGLAKAFEDAYDNANGHMRNVMNVLNDSTDEEFNSALKQICTDDYSAAVATAVNASMSFQNNIRGFMNGGTSQGTAVRSSREGVRDNYIYATLIGNTSSYDGDSSTTGFDSDSYGAVGAYEFGSGIGFSLGYLTTDTDYEDGRGSKSEADTYHIGTFYKYDNDRGLRVNTDLSLDYTTNDVERRIAFGGITETATSDFDSYIISVGTEVMYDIYLDNNFRVTPKVAFTYGRIEQDSFTESGASSLNVSQDSESYNSIRTSAGLEVAKEFIASSGTYEVSSYAQWNHEFGDIYDDQKISIQDLEGKFVVPGLNVSEDTYEVGVGAEYTTNSDTTYFISYSYEGESSYDNHTGKLGVKYSF